jgi:hypothetical protein
MKYITILILILISILFILIKYKRKETFYNLNSEYCGDCGKRGRFSCGKCVDCGFCVTADGRSSCVSGDAKGPYFNEDCAYWEHSQPWLIDYDPRYARILSYPPYNYRMPLMAQFNEIHQPTNFHYNQLNNISTKLNDLSNKLQHRLSVINE